MAKKPEPPAEADDGLLPLARERKSLAQGHKVEGDRCPSVHVVLVSIVLPFRLGPANWRGDSS
jgi:hypothetical protein